MALPWVRLDTQFPMNPKVLDLAMDDHYRAAFVYLCSLSYSGAHNTVGYIPRKALPFIHGTAEDAAHLVRVKLWKADKAGWYIPDWAEYQPPMGDTAEAKDAMRAGSKKGNCIRWHGRDCGCWREVPE